MALVFSKQGKYEETLQTYQKLFVIPETCIRTRASIYFKYPDKYGGSTFQAREIRDGLANLSRDL
jgi:hypothetical protein